MYHLRALILSGEITSWQQVYDYVTPQQMAKVLGRDAQHWGNVRNRPLLLTLGDMERIMEELNISKKRFLELVGGGD